MSLRRSDYHPAVIVFEGADNVGKTAMLNKVSAMLEARGVPYTTMRFPFNYSSLEFRRMTPMSRQELLIRDIRWLTEYIKGHQCAGRVVLINRYIKSWVVYGRAWRQNLNVFKEWDQIVYPDLEVVVHPSNFDEWDTLNEEDGEDLQFQRRVNKYMYNDVWARRQVDVDRTQIGAVVEIIDKTLRSG